MRLARIALHIRVSDTDLRQRASLHPLHSLRIRLRFVIEAEKMQTSV